MDTMLSYALFMIGTYSLGLIAFIFYSVYKELNFYKQQNEQIERDKYND